MPGPMRKVGILISAGTALLMAAACSSSSSPTQSTNASSGGGNSTSKGAWTIAAIGTYSGTGSDVHAPTKNVLKAWVDYTNNKGGINGHQIKIVFGDDQNTPSVGLSQAQTLINHDHPIAFVGSSSGVATSWAPYVEKQGIPIIGSGGATAASLGGSSTYYPVATDSASGFVLRLYAAKLAGAKKVGVMYCAESSVCTQVLPLFQSAADKLGMKLVGTQAVSSTAPSYVAPCLYMKDKGAEAIVPAIPNETITAVVKECAAQNYTPYILGGSGSITPEWATDPVFAKAIGTIDDFPWWEKSIPGVADFQAAMGKYDPDAMKSPAVAAEAWSSALIFRQAAEDGSLGEKPTPSDVITALKGLKGVSAGGITPTVDYTAAKRTVDCGYLFTVGDGKFKLGNDGKLACASQLTK